jgi:hypothetical protein
VVYKKVTSFASLDENGELIVDTNGSAIPFMAEFAEGKFGGNVSGVTGTFSGVLTAEAVDAVSNLTIAGNSVAKTTSVTATRSPPSGHFPEDASYKIMTANVVVPNEDTNGGKALINVYLLSKNNNNDRDQNNFASEFYLTLNGVEVWRDAAQRLGTLNALPNDMNIQLILDYSSGHNNLRLWVFTDDGANTPDAYAQNISMTIDYIRK